MISPIVFEGIYIIKAMILLSQGNPAATWDEHPWTDNASLNSHYSLEQAPVLLQCMQWS